MKRNNWPIEDFGIRPAGKQDECFYCQGKKGEQHKSGCVIRNRTVVVDITVRTVLVVPEDWEVSTIEFTEGSSCSNNIIRDINSLLERLEAANMCACSMITKEYVREADATDEKESQLFIDMSPS